VLGRGLLTGKYDARATFDPQDIRSRWLTPEYRAEFERQIALIEKLRPIATRAGFTLTQLAVKYALAHVAVAVALTGVRTPAQIEANAGISLLPAMTRAELESIRQATES
jgi:aryl-alcohol dehydrogenase-like predicted oxidoreductase